MKRGRRHGGGIGRRSLRTTVGIVLAAAIGAGAACDNPMAAPFPSGATPYQARPEYALWWRTTEQCSGLTGSMSDIEWFSLPGDTYTIGSESGIEGTWFANSNRILLASHSIDYGRTVRHEMLHALERRDGHSTEMFRVRCGGIVSCPGPCATEAGSFPDPPATAPVIAPQDLLLTLAVDPAVVTDSTDGWAVVTVSITNPFAYPVWVALVTWPDDPRYASSFGFGMGNLYPVPATGDVIDPIGPRLGLAANETRRFAFDAHLGPGDYTVQAWGIFNSDTTARITVIRH